MDGLDLTEVDGFETSHCPMTLNPFPCDLSIMHGSIGR